MRVASASTSLSINGLRLSVFLGVYPKELIKKQTVTLDARIAFEKPPQACLSDRLEDTTCYDQLIAHLKEKIAEKRFQLIEHFSHELYQLIKAYFPASATVALRVTKQPAIADLSGGISFEYGDQTGAKASLGV